MGSIVVGTSGWSYPHWSGTFYPQELPASDWLAWYARHFKSVEINNSFYQLPAAATLRQWRDTVGDDFEFAVKASRYVTHMKKLRDPAQTMPGFLQRMDTLGPRLGPVLLQLPPNWHANAERLEHFLQALPGDYRYVFEFRDPSWFQPAIDDLLTRYGAAFCIYELAGTRSPLTVTAPLIYVRLHGPGDAYQGDYDDETLRGWAQRFTHWASAGHDIHCYFDNDEAGYAAENAKRLQTLLQE